jgi:hypothetical protein
MGVGPGDLRVKRLKAGKLQPYIRARLKIEMGRGAKAMGGKIEDLHRDSAGASLAEARANVHARPLCLAAILPRRSSELACDCDWVAVVEHVPLSLRRA